MKHIEGFLTGVRDARIYYQAWIPEGTVSAAVVVVHGIGEHSGRYMNVVNHLVPLGCAVYAFDNIGHGKSDGAREFVNRFEDFTTTLTTYCDMVRVWQADKRIFLLGHSMGGLIAACYLLDNQDQFAGAILSAPSVKAGDSVSKVAICLSKILSVVAPRVGVLTLDANGISRDPEVVADYINDPLVFHGKTTARLAAELLRAIRRITAECEKIKLPFIVLQGCDDKHVDPAGAQMLYDRVSSPDKTIKIFDGLRHELFNEPECDLVLSEISDWLAARISTSR